MRVCDVTLEERAEADKKLLRFILKTQETQITVLQEKVELLERDTHHHRSYLDD